MSSMQQAMTAYGQAAETLAPARQIVLLYDGAIRRIKEARQAIEMRRINDRYIAIARRARSSRPARGCLDHERGGEIAAQLDQIYTYLVFRLQRINLEDDVAICDELVARLASCAHSWAQIADGDGADAQAAAGTSAAARRRPG